MYISLDAKMTSNDLDAQCLTMCLYTEKQDIFYAEFIDCYPIRIENNDYMMNEIVPKLKYINFSDICSFWEDNSSEEFNKVYNGEKNNVHVTGTKYFVFHELKRWLSNLSDGEFIFLTDYQYLSFIYIITHLGKYNIDTTDIYVSSALLDVNQMLSYIGKVDVDKSILSIDRDQIVKDNGLMLSGNNTSIALAIRNMCIFDLLKSSLN